MPQWLTTFSLDHRSVRLFRLALGVAIVCNAADLIHYAETYFALETWLPRTSLVRRFAFQASLLNLVPSMALAYALVLLTLVGGLCLIFNYRVRWISFFLYLLLLSINKRISTFGFGGDDLMLAMTLWSALLPSGSYEINRNSFSDWVSLGVYVQFVLVYLVAGFAKTSPLWWQTGEAVHVTLQSTFATPLGVVFGRAPDVLLNFLGLGILWLERLGWILFFVPWRTEFWRALGVSLFSLLHIGLWGNMYLGTFPFLNLVFLMLFLPTVFWQRWFPRLASPLGSSRSQFASNSVAALVVVLLLVWQILFVTGARKSSWGAWLSQPARILGLDQRWNLFAPSPPLDRLQGFVEGVTKTGETILLYEAQHPYLTPSQSVSIVYWHVRFQSYVHRVLRGDRLNELRARMVNYFCEVSRDRENNRFAQVKLKSRSFSIQNEGLLPQVRSLNEQDCRVSTSVDQDPSLSERAPDSSNLTRVWSTVFVNE